MGELEKLEKELDDLNNELDSRPFIISSELFEIYDNIIGLNNKIKILNKLEE